MSNQDPFQWPKEVQVSGRTYTISPEMGLMEMREVMESLEQEAAKLAALKYAAGYELEAEELELLGMEDDDD